jgi:hypothetical protein
MLTYDVTLYNDFLKWRHIAQWLSEKTSRPWDIVHRNHKTVHMCCVNTLQIYTICRQIWISYLQEFGIIQGVPKKWHYRKYPIVMIWMPEHYVYINIPNNIHKDIITYPNIYMHVWEVDNFVIKSDILGGFFFQL